MKNLQLLRKTRDWVAAGGDDQYKWNRLTYYDTQETYPDLGCGTACCVAGYAVAQAVGVKLVNEYGTAYYIPATARGFATAGAEALGISPGQAYDLFDERNTKETVLALLDDLIEQAGAEEC